MTSPRHIPTQATDDEPTFGRWLRQRRAALRLTQAALAQRAGCSSEVLRKFEAEVKRPSRELAERLAAALELPEADRSAFVQLARSVPHSRAEDEPTSVTSTVAQGSAKEPVEVIPPWLARTKFHPPRVRADALSRPRLLDAVTQALATARLVLVSAPAGAGKTTLLTTALASEAQHYVAWLALDEEDNDTVRFLYALVAAIQAAVPAFGAIVRRVLVPSTGIGHRDLPNLARQAVSALINDLGDTCTQPLVLVLDDLHTITEPTIHNALDYLLERMPPEMSIAIATRHDPPLVLARLRARRELAELRLPDLRFTVEEATGLLNERLGLQLASGQIAALHQRTEGWAAGLSLIAASLERMRTGAERTRFLHHLAQTDRYLFEYLAEEVLHRQDPFLRAFLLETAVLHELTPAACQAMTGRTDAESILDQLYRHNLFLIAQDNLTSGSTYRYHDLFRDFLRDRLRREAPEWLRQLHRRASLAETNPSRIVQHYLAAEVWDDAAAAIERVGEQFVNQGAFGTIHSWITALPPGTREAYPHLQLWLGICLWQRFAFDDAQIHFARALAAFETAGDIEGQGDALAWTALGLSLGADATRALALVERALGFAVQPAQRVRLLLAYALGFVLLQRWDETTTMLDKALAIAETTRDPDVITTLASNLHAPFSLLPGGVAYYERTLELLAPAAAKHGGTALISRCSLQALVHAWRGRWDEALAEMRALFAEITEADASTWQIMNVGGLTTLLTTIATGIPEPDPALDMMLNVDEHLSYAFTRSIAISFQYHYARSQWLQGNWAETRRVYEHILRLAQGSSFPYVTIMRLLLAGLIALGEKRFADAEALLCEAATIQDQTVVTVLYNDAYLLLAALYLEMDRPEDALARLAPRLAEYARYDVPGIVMWQGRTLVPALRLAVTRGVQASFAARVLELLGEPVASAASGPATTPNTTVVPGTGEVLSSRELEVLRLIATGASNAEIAKQLVISFHTAKAHVGHILAKLNVTSRTEASVRARDLGLI